MNWDEIEGSWTHFGGLVRDQWDKLSVEEIAYTEGKRHFLAMKIQEVYGLNRESTEAELSAWQHRQERAPSQR